MWKDIDSVSVNDVFVSAGQKFLVEGIEKSDTKTTIEGENNNASCFLTVPHGTQVEIV